MILLLQTIMGVVGNSSLFYHCVFLYCSRSRLKSTDLIVMNLTVANTFVLFSTGIHYTMLSFGSYHVFSDFGCRLFSYVRGVGRGVSIGTTCILSVLQAITISPRNSQWAQLKGKARTYIFSSMFLYWLLQMLINVIYCMFLSSNLNNKNITNRKSFGYCSSVRHDRIVDILYAALLSFPDALCFVLMLGASGFMVFILHRHQQKVQHIHRTHVFSRSSPVSRATKTILLMVSTFVFSNTLSSIFHIILTVFDNPSWILLNFSAIFTLCFPTISPFLLFCHESRVSRLSFA